MHIEISSADSCQSLQKAFAASDVSKIEGLPINQRAFLVSSSGSAEGSGREVDAFGRNGEGEAKREGVLYPVLLREAFFFICKSV